LSVDNEPSVDSPLQRLRSTVDGDHLSATQPLVDAWCGMVCHQDIDDVIATCEDVNH
jgi:hypothetical protein